MPRIDIESEEAQAEIREICELRHALLDVAKDLTEVGRDFLRLHDLTEPGSSVLWELSEPLSVSEVARRLKCRNTNVCHIADRLEAHGLIRREKHPTDNRVILLVLTKRGESLRRAVGEHLRTAYALSDLTAEERTIYKEISERLASLRPRGKRGPG